MEFEINKDILEDYYNAQVKKFLDRKKKEKEKELKEIEKEKIKEEKLKEKETKKEKAACNIFSCCKQLLFLSYSALSMQKF